MRFCLYLLITRVANKFRTQLSGFASSCKRAPSLGLVFVSGAPFGLVSHGDQRTLKLVFFGRVPAFCDNPRGSLWFIWGCGGTSTSLPMKAWTKRRGTTGGNGGSYFQQKGRRICHLSHMSVSCDFTGIAKGTTPFVWLPSKNQHTHTHAHG